MLFDQRLCGALPGGGAKAAAVVTTKNFCRPCGRRLCAGACARPPWAFCARVRSRGPHCALYDIPATSRQVGDSMPKSKGRPLLQGAFLLMASNIVVKLIGVIYKIPLTNLIGGYGMGFFNSAYEVHLLLLAFSTAGLPVAVSKMVSESLALGRRTEAHKILRVTLVAFTALGLAGALAMLLGANAFSGLIGSPLTRYSIVALAPATLFFSVTAVFRGYYQGFQNMMPTAFSQVAEALVKLAAGLGLAGFLLSAGFGAEYVAAGAIAGTTLSTLLAAVLVAGCFLLPSYRSQYGKAAQQGGECRSSAAILGHIFTIVLPISVGALVVNLTGFLDLFLIMNRLNTLGASQMQAVTSYGAYKSCAQTLFNLPPSIIASINISVVPAVAAVYARKNNVRLAGIVSTAVRVTLLLAIPCAIGLMVLAQPILAMLFPVRPQEVALAAPLLQVLGPASLLVCLASLSTAILQAVGKAVLPVLSLLAGGLVKLAANYLLIGNPRLGILGAPIATNLCYLAILLINLGHLRRCGIRLLSLAVTLRPLLAGLLMGAFAQLANSLLGRWLGSQALGTLAAVGLSAVAYMGLLVLVGGVRRSDLGVLPGGHRLADWLHLE